MRVLPANSPSADARAEAERIHGPLGQQPFLLTDNGTSFMAKRFAKFVRDEYCHIRIQYRTPTQLGLLERFHETLKREEVYWRIYDNPQHARECLADFGERYNHRRPHWARIPVEGGDPMTPADVYVDGLVTRLPRWQGWAREVKATHRGDAGSWRSSRLTMAQEALTRPAIVFPDAMRGKAVSCRLPGRRWSTEGANAMLRLGCAWALGRFDEE